MDRRTPISVSLSVSLIILIVAVAGLSACSGTAEHVSLQPGGVGFKKPLPRTGTRVVMWGNHSAAIDQVSSWLAERGVTILDRTWVQQGFSDREVRAAESAKDWEPVLAAGRRVGAELVTFVEVSNVKGGQKFALSQVRAAPSFSLTVEIRSVDPATGRIETKAKAWQTGPDEEVDVLIARLTTLALEWAWESEPDAALYAEPTDPQRTHALALGGDKPTAGTDQVIASPRDIAASSRSDRSHLDGHDPPLTSHVSPRAEQRDVVPLHADSTYLDAFTPVPTDHPAPPSEPSPSVGARVASGMLSLLYTPAKLVYAGLGGLFGGLAYVLTVGDERAATSVWRSSVEGDYYLTPSQVAGEAPVHFIGGTVPDRLDDAESEAPDTSMSHASPSGSSSP